MSIISTVASTIPADIALRLERVFIAARKAGEIITDGYNQSRAVDEKGFGDLVSQIDLDCDRVIQDEIRRIDPDSVLITEEISPDTAPPTDSFWVVDPLDATSSYLYRTGSDVPSVMIARCEAGVTLFSVVYFPLTNELFYAVKGHGAFKGKVKLMCPRYNNLTSVWVEMNQYADSRLESTAFRSLYKNLRLPGGPALLTSSPPNSGIGVRIAEGQKRLAAVVHDNNPNKVKQAVWDVIPPALILEEAGGSIMTLGGQPYDPFTPEPFILAASTSIAQEIIAKSPRG